MRVCAVNPREFEDSREGSRNSADECTCCAVSAPEEILRFAFRPFRRGQAIQRFAKERRYWEEDGLAVLHRVQVDAVFANAIASKCSYVADSKSGIPEKEDLLRLCTRSGTTVARSSFVARPSQLSQGPEH